MQMASDLLLRLFPFPGQPARSVPTALPETSPFIDQFFQRMADAEIPPASNSVKCGGFNRVVNTCLERHESCVQMGEPSDSQQIVMRQRVDASDQRSSGEFGCNDGQEAKRRLPVRDEIERSKLDRNQQQRRRCKYYERNVRR